MPTQAELARAELARRELARRAAAGNTGVGATGSGGSTYSRGGDSIPARISGAVEAAGQGAQDAIYESGNLVRFLPGGQIVAATQPLVDEAYRQLPRYQPSGMVERNAMRVGALAPNAAAPGGVGTRIASVVIPWVTGAIGQTVGGDTGQQVGEVIGGLMTPGGERTAAEDAGRLLRRHGRNMGATDTAHLNTEAARLRASGANPTFTDVTNPNGRAITGTIAGRGVTGAQQVNEFVAARERRLPGQVVDASRTHVSATPAGAPARIETVPPGEAGAAVSTTLNTSRDAALRNVDRAYNEARAAGAERLLAPRTEIPTIRNTLHEAVVNGWDEGTAPAVYREIDNLTTRQDVTVEDLMRTRTRLTNLTADTANPVQASAARAARRALDAEITRLEPLVTGADAAGPNAVAAWRRANARRARFGRQYEGGDLLERLTAREVRGGENNVQTIPPEGASAAALGSAAGTIRVDGNTVRDLRRLRARLGPNSPEWTAFQQEATDRLMGTDPNRYGERFRDFETRYRSRGLVDLLVPPARQAELRAAQGEAAGRRLMDPNSTDALAAIPATQLQDARNAAAGVIERRARSGNPRGLTEDLRTPEMHSRLTSILGSEEAAHAFEQRLATEGAMVDRARDIVTPAVPQMSNPTADAVQTMGAATALVGGAQHGMLFSQTARWASKFRIRPEDADRFTAAVLDPSQTDAILREVRRGYGPSAERAMRGIIRRARRNVGTAGAVSGNSE